jgi:hypothetical protein
VEGHLKGQELVPAGVETRQLHGALDRLGAAVGEERLAQTPAGSDTRDRLGQVGDRLHVVHVRRAVDELVHLLARGRHYLGVVVACVHDRDAGEAVDVFAAVLVPDQRAAGAIDRDRLHLDEARHHVVLIAADGVVHGGAIVPWNARSAGKR